MEEKRCPECGYRLTSNYCPICCTYVSFGPKPKKTKRNTSDWQTEVYTEPQPAQTHTAPKQTKYKSKKATPNKMLRRIVLVFAIFWLVSFIFSLVSQIPLQDDYEDVYDEYEYVEEVALFEPAGSPGAEDVPTIEPAELYNADGITVTANSLGIYNEDNYGICITIENGSEQNMTLSVETLCVNDYLLFLSGLYCDVEAGETRDEYIEIRADELANSGIDTIANVAFTMNMYDSDEYTTIEQMDVSLDTSAADGFVQVVDDSGIEVYNEDGIRVVFREMTVYDDGSFATACFFVENTSDREMSIGNEELLINGQTSDASLWALLQPGTRCVDEVYFFDIDELDISCSEDLKEMSISLDINDMENWENETITDLITIDLSEQ